MAFDLDYLIVDCDHRIHDDVVQSAVDLQSVLVSGDAILGEDLFGDTEFGEATYKFGSYAYGTSGYFIPYTFEQNSVIAVFPLKYKIASEPKVYVKLPTEYLRTPVPEFSYESQVSSIYYNGYHFYGDDSLYGSDGYEPNSDLVSAPYVLWKVVYGDPSTLYRTSINRQDIILPGETLPGVYGNSVIIFRYDNRFDWIIDYNVELSSCPKCFGTSITNDIHLTPRGKLVIVLGTDKLVQSVSKAILSDRGANPYFPWYGTVIKDLITNNRQQSAFIIRGEIIDQLTKLKEIQTEVEAAAPGYYDPAERLEDIVSIQSLPTPDPRTISLRVTVLARTLQQVQSKKLTVIRR